LTLFRKALQQPTTSRFKCAFPDHYDAPAGCAKRSLIAPITFDVSVEFALPKRDI